MISNVELQKAVIAKLKANADLVNWLTARSANDEIRETSWQGTVFTYPAVRADVGTQVPGEITSKCYLTTGEIPFTVLSFSESDSSQQADELASLVNIALVGTRLSGTGFGSLSIQSDGLTHAVRTGERLWRAVGLYRMQVYET
jgi:hypothetical protein